MTEDASGTSAGTTRVRRAIVEAAARVLTHEASASMQAVAQAAGVGRATLYRHFASREALVAAMRETALTATGESLERARLGQVPVDEAIARATRALLMSVEQYAVAPVGTPSGNSEHLTRLVVAPLTALLARGQAEGVLRADVPAELLYLGWIGMTTSLAPLVVRVGVEDASDAIVRTFLDGARAAQE